MLRLAAYDLYVLTARKLAAPAGLQPAVPIVKREQSLGGKAPTTPSLPAPGSSPGLAAQAAAQLGADVQAAPGRKLAEGGHTCANCGQARHKGLCSRPRQSSPQGDPMPRGMRGKAAELPVSLNSATGDSPTRALARSPRAVIQSEMQSARDIGTSRTMPQTVGMPSATGIEQNVSGASAMGPALID